MGLGVQTHTPSIVNYYRLRDVRQQLDRSLERLQTGSKVNHPEDDPYLLARSEALRWQIHSLKLAERNAQDGISTVQITQGAVAVLSDKLIRLKNLALQAASGTNTHTQREFIQIEFQTELDEIKRALNSPSLHSISILSHQKSGTNSLQPVVPSSVSALEAMLEELQRNQNPLSIQVGTKNNPTSDQIQFHPLNTLSLPFLGLNDLAVDQQASAQKSLEKIDSAADAIFLLRNHLGTLEKRIETSLKNIRWARDNYSYQNNLIQDTDLAEETATLAKNQILMESGTAMLAQANAKNEQVLKLLEQRIY